MITIRNILGSLCLILIANAAHGAGIPLSGVTSDDFKKVNGDISANFLHTSVSGAGSLGHIWGFEVGVVGGLTSTPHLNDVVHKSDPNTDAGKLYNAEILGAVSVPFGITGEVGLLPKMGNSDIKFSAFSLAAKWTFTDVFLSDLPFSMAVKGIYTTTTLDAHTATAGITANYTYTGKETAAQFLISKNLAILEPYAGVGIINAKGDMTTDQPLTFSPASNSMGGTKSGTMFMVGTEVKLLVLKLGVEYANLLDTSRFSGKLSFYF